MLLTDEERAKFAAYLKSEIEGNELILKQMAKLPGLGMAIGPRQAEIDATKLVLAKLISWEPQTL